ncbi:unnamed protein product, partial [Cyprideis torosa]
MESRSSESTRSGTVLYEFHEGVPYEGQLLKFTNLVKGFQHRWFILHPVAGTLAYYLDKNDNRSEAPRGAIYLGGAQVYPSDDDSRTFSVNPVKGDPFKLRAADAKGRQDWISRLRTVIHLHNEEIARNHPPLPPREEAGPATERIRPKVTLPSLNMADALASAREIVNYAHVTHDSLVKAVDRLPQPLSAQISGSSPPPPLTTLCPDVLALKATSLAALTSLQSCLEMVFQLAPPPPLTTLCPDVLALKATSLAALTSLQSCLEMVFQLGLAAEGKPRCRGVSSSSSQETSDAPPKSEKSFASTPAGDCVGKAAKINHEEEGSDEEVTVSSPLASAPDPTHPSPPATPEGASIATVLGHVKLGADLTKVSLPSSILDRRSFLEFMADCLCNVDLFCRIYSCEAPQDEMKAVLSCCVSPRSVRHCNETHRKKSNVCPSIQKQRYRIGYSSAKNIAGNGLTRDSESAIHQGCPKVQINDQGHESVTAMAHELQCFKEMMRQHLLDRREQKQLPHACVQVMVDGSERVVRYTAEQVSHHPPVSCLSLTCPSLGLTFSCSLLLKAKFLGMAVGVSLIGSAVLTTPKDSYSLTFPSLYARSIVTQPWVEFGGEVGVVAQHSGWRSAITFHTK